uniref:Immunoglobulin V-set domain-containing protein n=1 Tax=Esox lucius TaxID=8010 RepID=A0AAY5L9Z8_ESOLU
MRTPHLVTLSTPLLVGRYLTASELMEIQKRLAGVWIFFFTHSFLVSCEIRFLGKQLGDSATFVCVSDVQDPKPIAFNLKRKWIKPDREVMFMYTKEKPAPVPDFSQRLNVTGDPSTERVNVTISQLKGTDTDLYYCLFVYPKTNAPDENIPGKDEFFLYVDDADVSCSCSGYVPLLYALSAAVGLLLILLLALAVAHYGKIGHDRVKPQSSIYEEMVGGRPPNRNRKTPPSYLRPPHHLEEMNAPDYDHPPPRSRHENLYERPDGALLIPTETAVVA